MNDDRRLIEDYLPIEDISAESSREKSPRRATSRPLHPWWARRPLVACRTAVYGTLMPAPTRKENRDKEAAFARQLAKYPCRLTIRAEARVCRRLWEFDGHASQNPVGGQRGTSPCCRFKPAVETG
jgi:putative DNA methylase